MLADNQVLSETVEAFKSSLKADPRTQSAPRSSSLEPLARYPAGICRSTNPDPDPDLVYIHCVVIFCPLKWIDSWKDWHSTSCVCFVFVFETKVGLEHWDAGEMSKTYNRLKVEEPASLHKAKDTNIYTFLEQKGTMTYFGGSCLIIVCQRLILWVTNSSHSINIWGIIIEAMQKGSVYKIASHETNLALLGHFLQKMADLSILFIHAMAYRASLVSLL